MECGVGILRNAGITLEQHIARPTQKNVHANLRRTAPTSESNVSYQGFFWWAVQDLNL